MIERSQRSKHSKQLTTDLSYLEIENHPGSLLQLELLSGCSRALFYLVTVTMDFFRKRTDYISIRTVDVDYVFLSYFSLIVLFSLASCL